MYNLTVMLASWLKQIFVLRNFVFYDVYPKSIQQIAKHEFKKKSIKSWSKRWEPATTEEWPAPFLSTNKCNGRSIPSMVLVSLCLPGPVPHSHQVCVADCLFWASVSKRSVLSLLQLVPSRGWKLYFTWSKYWTLIAFVP